MDQNGYIWKKEFPFKGDASAVESLNFVNKWEKLRQTERPVEDLSRILQHSLYDGDRVMDRGEADEIALEFVGNGGRCLTNILFDEDGDAIWTPMTESDFNAGLIIIHNGYLRCFWVEY